jgi:hypothetical protein
VLTIDVRRTPSFRLKLAIPFISAAFVFRRENS